MKLKSVILAGIAALGLAGTVSAAPVKVGVAAEPYPPFTSPDASGKWSGWEVDLMNAICTDQKLDCVITPVAWDGIIPALTSGQIDMIMSSMSITAKRAKVVDFSDKYYVTPAAIAVAKDATFGMTPEDLTGKVIGVQVSTTNEAYAQKFFGKTSTIKQYQTQDQVNQDLAAGRIDADVADQFTLDAFVTSKDGKACCKMLGALPYDNETLGTGIGAAFRKSDTALREKFNKGLADVRASGDYDKITKKYFSFDIYGG
ncbi:transporter substrate-binding domain-containing protein [Acidimangrovimonas pyrenivorans]|uniref:Transporter substrate-binding domain-containing protein n=1 Tax=Acidimangrovimonas pyrenivorans TaxID=2030798 RepID=A0ABV7AIS6_9RHOB